MPATSKSLGSPRPLHPHRHLLVGVLVCLSVLLSACSSSPDPDAVQRDLRTHAANSHVVLVLLDAAAAAHFGYMGYARDTTPNIDALAAESIVFETAYSQAASTAMSVFAMMSSSYPLFETKEVQGNEITFEVSQEIEMMAEAFEPLFPHRIAVSGNQWVSQRFDFDQGFTQFHETWQPSDRHPTTHPRAPLVLEAFRTELSGFAQQRSFAYLHFLEPHTPYTPPDEYARRYHPDAIDRVGGTVDRLLGMRSQKPRARRAEMVQALYDGNLAYVDAKVGELIEDLKREGHWDNTVFVLIADHGEAFWQHGSWGHGRHVYEEYVRVPFLLRIPGASEHAGQRIARPVSLVDLLPTLADLLGLRPDDDWVGDSLLPVIAGESPAETEPASAFFRNTHLLTPEFGTRRGPIKWIVHDDTGIEEAYDLRTDPGESSNLLFAGDPDEETLRARERLLYWKETGTGSIVPVDSLDAETAERLRSLGYLR